MGKRFPDDYNGEDPIFLALLIAVYEARGGDQVVNIEEIGKTIGIDPEDSNDLSVELYRRRFSFGQSRPHIQLTHDGEVFAKRALAERVRVKLAAETAEANREAMERDRLAATEAEARRVATQKAEEDLTARRADFTKRRNDVIQKIIEAAIIGGAGVLIGRFGCQPQATPTPPSINSPSHSPSTEGTASRPIE